MRNTILLTLSLFVLFALSACGNKGPLVVEQSPGSEVVEKTIGSPASDAQKRSNSDDTKGSESPEK